MIDKNILKINGMKSLMVKLAGISFLQALFVLGQALALTFALDGFFHGQSVRSKLIYIAVFALCFLGRHVSEFLEEKLAGTFALKAGKDLRRQLMEKVFNLGAGFIQKEGSGALAVSTLDGVSKIENYISLISLKTISMMVMPIVIFFGILYMDWLSAIILVAVFPISIGFMILFGKNAKAKADRQFEGYKRLSNHFVDSLQGLVTLKIMGKSKSHGQNVFNVSEDYRKATMDTLRVAMLSTFALDFFTTLSVALVAVSLGVRLIDNNLEFLPAMAVLILAPEFFLPLRQFAEDYHGTLDGKNAMKDIDKMLALDEIPVTKLLPDAFQMDENFALKVKDLTFAYKDNSAFTLDTVNLDIKGIGKIGIIGKSGGGKTTLLNLLGGFLKADEGSIQISGLDGQANGFNVQLESLSDWGWQQSLMYIPQKPHIFSGTVRDNIAFYRPDATLEEVCEAAKKVGLHQLVMEMEQGYDTKIGQGEGHRALSGGQAHRIALARAFLCTQRKILLFDEPTAGLDLETEIELKEYILKLSEGKLVFFSTHRLHFMEDMDKVLVIDGGRIVEEGSYKELNQPGTAFTHLANRMRGQEDE